MNIKLEDKEVKLIGKVIESVIDRDYDDGLFYKEELEIMNNFLVKVRGEGFDVKFWE